MTIKNSNNNFLEFKNKVLSEIKYTIDLIDAIDNQAFFILEKSFKILEEFITRAESGEFYIRKDAKISTIAATIIYTVIISNENMPEINIGEISKISKVSTGNISRYYKTYFKKLYPRKEFLFPPGFKHIKDIISSYFFGLIKEKEIKTTDLVSRLKENILKNTNLPKLLTQEDINSLREMITHYIDQFDKYFSDLAEVVKILILYSRTPKKINARISIKPLAYLLNEKEINLLHIFETLYLSVLEIYDFLKEKFPDFFPKRFQKILSEDQSRTEYRTLVGNNIKLYIVKNIHNGRYFLDGKCRCPECYREGFKINTDKVRTSALEFHHETEEKEYKYTARKLMRLYEKNKQLNPHFLEDLIEQMESKGVIVLCSVHHRIKHAKYYLDFKRLINWQNIPKRFPQDIFSLPSELIHLIIRASVSNFWKIKKSNSRFKEHIARYQIVRYLRKRYIIEHFFGNKCPTCQEIDTINYLPAFDFHHISHPRFHENPYIHKEDQNRIETVSNLYDKDYICSEIAQILEFERGGYLCTNCHTVIQYSPYRLKLLSEIYKDDILIKEIKNDHLSVKNNFKLFQNISSIKNPLKCDIQIYESYEKYLDAIYELSLQRYDVTPQTLKDHLGFSSLGGVYAFLSRHEDFIRYFVEIEHREKYSIPPKYILTEQGKIYIELLQYFREYYKNL